MVIRFLCLTFLVTCFLFSSARAETVIHSINWEPGVNKKTIKEWIVSLDKVSNISSTTYIKKKSGGKDELHRVKHRDVIIWIPASTDLSKEFVTVIWFHGHWGYVPSRTFEDRTLKQFVPLAPSKNFVLVLPEMPWSVHGKTPRKRNSMLWMKPGDFVKFTKQVTSVLEEHNSGKGLGKTDYRIVGHSAGGSTIKRLGLTGDLCKIEPSMVVWSDSSYGRWLENAWDGCLGNHPNILVKVFVARGDSPWKNAIRFLGDFQEMPESFEFYIMNKPRWSHKLIGNNIVELSGVLN